MTDGTRPTLLGVPVRAESRVPRGYIVYIADSRMYLLKVPNA